MFKKLGCCGTLVVLWIILVIVLWISTGDFVTGVAVALGVVFALLIFINGIST